MDQLDVFDLILLFVSAASLWVACRSLMQQQQWAPTSMRDAGIAMISVAITGP